MTRNSYLRRRQVSEAGLISEILLALATEARRTRSQAALGASRVKAIGRGADNTGERTRRAQRELDLMRRAPISDR
jgi:hypothetical protein